MVDSASFWDKAAAKYVASPIKDIETYEAWLAQVRAHLKPTDKVLEMGCGSGATALLLADSVAHITATDISANMISYGFEQAKTDGVENITFTQAVAGETPLPGPFDVVMAFNLIHLLPDPMAALVQMREQMAPGGLLITKTPCLANKWLWRIPINVLQLIGKAPHVNFFSQQQFEDVVTQSGFEIIEAETYPKGGMSRLIIARKI
ncbi:MAG: class I SAM-dependent methyltransferase [Alphaproteobacteria bacterium]